MNGGSGAVIKCKIDGKDQELTIPADVLAKFAWTTWAEHATPENIVRTTVPIPVQQMKSGAGQDKMYLILQLAGGWDISLELNKTHLPAMRGDLPAD